MGSGKFEAFVKLKEFSVEEDFSWERLEEELYWMVVRSLGGDVGTRERPKKDVRATDAAKGAVGILKQSKVMRGLIERGKEAKKGKGEKDVQNEDESTDS